MTTEDHRLKQVLAEVRERKKRMKQGMRAGAAQFFSQSVIDIMDDLERFIADRLIDP